MNCKKVGVRLGLAAAVTLATLSAGATISYAAPAQNSIISTATYQADLSRSFLVADEPTESTRLVTRITTDFLNVRSGPSTDANILGVLNIGVEVKGTQEGDWFKTEYSGQTAYVHADWLRKPGSAEQAGKGEEPEIVARYTTDNLNVRSGQGTSFNILGVLKKGTKVTGEDLGEWFRIDYEGQTGYVHTDYLKASADEAKEAENANLQTQYATAYVNVRSGPGTRNDILGVLEPNTKVEGTYEGHWFKTRYAGQIAYVSGSYLSDGEAETPESVLSNQNLETKYTKDILNVRSGPGTSHSILGVLDPGTELKGVVEGEWFRIEYNGEVAYVYDPYLVSTNPNAPKEQTKSDPVSTSSTIQAIINDAWNQVGKSYVYGTAGPDTFDCSGLTYYLYDKHAGIQLPRSSASQASAGTEVSRSEMQPGDLIFFINSGASRIGHVAIYVGGDTYIHASTPSTGVKTDSISGSYFQDCAVTIKRILP